MKYDRRLVGAVPVAAIAGALGATLLLGGPSQPVTAQDTTQLTREQRSTATSLEGAFMKIADAVEPATVSITARVEATRPSAFAGPGEGDDSPFGGLPFFRGMPLPQQPRVGTATGSGVIVRQDGYILTNDHVVANAKDGVVKVTLSDGTEYNGKVYRDPRSDLAVVKIDADKPLPYVRFADSSSLHIGQWAVAIGSPFGKEGTMTAGIVSALKRKADIGAGPEARRYPNLIQTDASINPGNSGGPLLNINGELIGINVAIYSPTGTNAGIGYAIPANTAKIVMEQLITNGKVVRGYLGLVPEDILPGLRSRLGTADGAYVSEVSPDTPADKAGIRPNDAITRFGDKTITGEADLRDAIGATAPGSRVAVTLLRDGKTQSVDVVIGTPELEPVALAAPAPPRPASKLGIGVQALSSDLAGPLKLPAGVQGVVVERIEPGSPADASGLLPRDVITALNGKSVTNPEALNQAVSGAKSGDILTLGVLRFRGTEKPSRVAVNVSIP